MGGCGVHVHSGTSCDNTTTQGGHYYEGDVAPWADIGYTSTTAFGYAEIPEFSVEIGNLNVLGKPLIVHANDGSRIACGIIEKRSLTREELLRLRPADVRA